MPQAFTSALVVQCVCLVLLPIVKAINKVNPTQHQPAWPWKHQKVAQVPRWAPSQGWGCVRAWSPPRGAVSSPLLLPLLCPSCALLGCLWCVVGEAKQSGKAPAWLFLGKNSISGDKPGSKQLGAISSVTSWQEVSASPAYAELLVAVLRLKRELC